MNSDGITVSAPDIYQLRCKLGMQSPWLSVNLSGSTADPQLKVNVDGESHIFKKVEPALQFIKRHLNKRMIVPKKAKAKKRRRR